MPLPKGVTAKRTKNDNLVLRIHYSADPDRDEAWAAKERKKYSSQGAWDREQNIVHEAGGGERLFAECLSQFAEKIIIDNPQFQVPPQWRTIAAFDYGKTNPTAALVAKVDYEGSIYVLAEYYQPGLSPKQHQANLLQLRGFMEAETYADPSIFYKTQAQSDGSYRAVNDLYVDVGIDHMGPAPHTTEITGMERILSHWLNIEEQEPTLKIRCPKEKTDIQRPIYGVHNDGCPNLLWELRRARREELSASQLMRRNPSEKVVDKDNHLRDCLKYIILSLPDPAIKSTNIRAQEHIKPLVEAGDLTSALIRRQQFIDKEEQDTEQPIFVGRRRY